MDWHSRIVQFDKLHPTIKSVLRQAAGKGVYKVHQLHSLTSYTALKMYLEYEGIIGYTDHIIRTVQSIEGASE